MKIDLPILDSVGTNYGPTSVRIGQFFMSYNSVMTLAYDFFSRTLLNVKAHVESAMQGKLKSENTGSRWPKTTLGCFVQNTPLNEKEVMNIRNICSDFTLRMRALSEDDLRVPIGELHVVAFGCRTLERQFLSLVIRLNGAVLVDDTPPISHVEYVKEVMTQFTKNEHEKYYPNLDPKGRTLDSYYRRDHVESTLIANVFPSEKAMGMICEFTQEVDRMFPGIYEWFEPSSWNLTVRALVPN